MSSSKGEIARRKIVKAIYDFNSFHQYPPSIQDIKKLSGIRSFNTVGRHLKVLKEQGLIDWEDNIGQEIKITDDTLIMELLKEQV